MTQKEAVLYYMQTHPKGISQKEATSEYGITRLAAVIFRLKKEIPIGSKIETTITRFGTQAHYSRYFLKDEA